VPPAWRCAALVRGDLSGTSRRLTFSGQTSIVIPAGAVAVSDAVDLDVPARADLAVSVYLPTETDPLPTTRRRCWTPTFAVAGNFTGATDLPGAAVIISTFYLSAVEVLPSEPIPTLVAFGDSLTQGEGSSRNANRTWPDFLSARLNPNPSRPRLAVINQGIGCGRCCGISADRAAPRDSIATFSA
jgi:hypothetical protein